jgi:hypothetical protein
LIGVALKAIGDLVAVRDETVTFSTFDPSSTLLGFANPTAFSDAQKLPARLRQGRFLHFNRRRESKCETPVE